MSSTVSETDVIPNAKPVRMFSHPARPILNDSKFGDGTKKRNIEPQQNWLARLFRVKPATKHLCFSISPRRARQETVILLKEWRQYGIRDIEVDKQRNIVFAQLGQKNCKQFIFRLLIHSVTAPMTNTMTVRPQFERSRVRHRNHDGD